MRSKRPRRFPESSIHILTDLPGCVAHEVAICFVLPWLNVLRCSLGRQAGILRGAIKHESPLQISVFFFRTSVASLLQDVSGFNMLYIHSFCMSPTAAHPPTFLPSPASRVVRQDFAPDWAYLHTVITTDRQRDPHHSQNSQTIIATALCRQSCFICRTSQSNLHWIFTGSSGTACHRPKLWSPSPCL